MTKSEVKTKGKEIKSTTKFRVKKYVLLVESVLLGAAGVLAISEAYKLRGDKNTIFYLAAVAGVYALVEALAKLDKAVTQK